jgi:tRNA A-37 threonylcarbamoyl transferase component Bud32
MKPSKYIQKTFRRGNFLGKFIKLLRLFQHSFYYLFNKKVGSYPSPPDRVEKIGFFDKNRRVHTDAENQKYFSEINLYREGDYTEMKPDVISLVKLDDCVMVRKSFSGFQKYNKFYNELICLHLLRDIGQVPKLKYVEYSSCTLYLEYLDGLSVSRKRKDNKLVINSENYVSFKKGYTALLSRLHEKEVMMYDMRHDNMMIFESSCYLFDFGDSIYTGNILSYFTHRLKRIDYKLLDKEMYRSASDESIREQIKNGHK